MCRYTISDTLFLNSARTKNTTGECLPLYPFKNISFNILVTDKTKVLRKLPNESYNLKQLFCCQRFFQRTFTFRIPSGAGLLWFQEVSAI